MNLHFPLIPESRPFKTLSSIMKCNETKPFLKFISLTDSFFQQIFSFEYEKALEILLNFINNNPRNEDEMNILYCFNLILITYGNMPKHRNYFSPIIDFVYNDDIITNFSPNSSNFINKMLEIGKTKDIFISDIQSFSPLPKDYELPYILNILQNDKLDELKQYINSSNDFHFNKADDKICYFHVFRLFNEVNHQQHDKISYIEYCAAYGSKDCFSYFMLNHAYVDDVTNKFAILSGNIDIIHMLESSSNDSSSFDFLFRFSIIGHNLNISEWLLSNFKCEFFSPADCILLNDYRAFLFLVLNGANLSVIYKNIQSPISHYYFPLTLTCKIRYSLFESIKLLVENGANINEINYEDDENNIFSSIYYLCKRSLNFNIKELEYLLEKGGDPNIGEISPLYLCCNTQNPSQEVISLLLKYGANPNINERSPLKALCEKKQINRELIEYLIHNGADINYGSPKPFYSLCMNENKNMELIQLFVTHGAEMERSLLYECMCKKLDLETIKYLYENGANINLKQVIYYYDPKFIQLYATPLSLACQSNNIEIIQYLLQQGAKIDNKNASPLYNICCQSNANNEIIKLLLENGADPNYTVKRKFDEQDQSSSTFYVLCDNNKQNLEAINLLLSYGADADCINDVADGHSFIELYHSNILCALCNTNNINLEVLKTALKHKKDMNNGNQNPINNIVMQETINFEAISLLIEYGVDINKTSKIYDKMPLWSQFSPFSYLCYHYDDLNIDTLKYFIEKGADVNSLYTHYSQLYKSNFFSPLYCLFSKKTINLDLIKFLVSQKADPNVGTYSILNFLCEKDEPDISLVKYAIEIGCNVNQLETKYTNHMTYTAFSPLFICCNKQMANCDLIQLLLENGADPNISCIIRDYDYMEYTTPFLAFVQHNQNGEEALKLLLDHGADVNKCQHIMGNGNRNEYHSPLYALCAAKVIKHDSIKLLIQRGAIIDQETKDYIQQENIAQLFYLLQ